MIPRIALTSGEPAGIGPELCLALALRELPCELTCLGDAQLLAARARELGIAVEVRERAAAGAAAAVGTGAAVGTAAAAAAHVPGRLDVLHVPLLAPSLAGRPDAANARYVLSLLDRAIHDTLAGCFDALVTAPVHKGIINEAGIDFTGHTEYLAQRSGGGRAVMLLTTGDELRVALATTHVPLRAVSAALTVDSLFETGAILARELTRWFGIGEPRIAVCGLNPHAGEGGYLGDEEIRVIAPAIARLRSAGVRVSGPLSADSAFVPRSLARCDAVLAMYHDQGLPVIKHAGFERAVNVTLGLPLLRTSPDHGTALDLAGSGRADPRSLIAAVQLAARLAAQRR